jgi:hypothetical protein
MEDTMTFTAILAYVGLALMASPAAYQIVMSVLS